jgi:hypothetical protein
VRSKTHPDWMRARLGGLEAAAGVGTFYHLALTWARLIAVEFPLALGAADLPHAYRRPISEASHVRDARYAAY